MIIFNSENDYKVTDPELLKQWIIAIVTEEEYSIDEMNIIFCNDDYLHNLNVEYLAHDTLTDVIGFDYSVGKKLQGDIFISTERVSENAKLFEAPFEKELHRVIIHGVLHFLGYSDKSEKGKTQMRSKENEALASLNYDYS